MPKTDTPRPGSLVDTLTNLEAGESTAKCQRFPQDTTKAEDIREWIERTYRTFTSAVSRTADGAFTVERGSFRTNGYDLIACITATRL